jgi:hypothetical protein
MTQSRWITNNWEIVFQTSLGLEIIVDNHLSEAAAKKEVEDIETHRDGHLIAREMKATGNSEAFTVTSSELTSGAFPG